MGELKSGSGEPKSEQSKIRAKLQPPQWIQPRMSREKSTLWNLKATFSNKLRRRHVESIKSEEKEQEEGTTLNKT